MKPLFFLVGQYIWPNLSNQDVIASLCYGRVYVQHLHIAVHLNCCLENYLRCAFHLKLTVAPSTLVEKFISNSYDPFRHNFFVHILFGSGLKVESAMIGSSTNDLWKDSSIGTFIIGTVAFLMCMYMCMYMNDYNYSIYPQLASQGL